jgi:hypothetical protein
LHREQARSGLSVVSFAPHASHVRSDLIVIIASCASSLSWSHGAPSDAPKAYVF